MKTPKIVMIIMLAGLFTITMGSCKKCRNENPRARIVNNGTADASVQIKTSGGNTENINNISSGTASEFRSYAPGSTTFTISIAQDNSIYTAFMSECYEYDISIDGNNNITSTPTDRNE